MDDTEFVPEFDAVLLDWTMVQFDGPPVLIGRIMNDRCGRFADGRWIATSALATQPCDVRPGEIVRTRNSRYLLGGRVH